MVLELGITKQASLSFFFFFFIPEYNTAFSYGFQGSRTGWFCLWSGICKCLRDHCQFYGPNGIVEAWVPF